MTCEKLEYVGAVTLVRFSADGSLLFVGVGPAISVYTTASGALLVHLNVFPRGILHGCDFGASSWSRSTANGCNEDAECVRTYTLDWLLICA